MHWFSTTPRTHVGDIALAARTANTGTTQRSLVIFRPWPVYIRGNSPRSSLNRRGTWCLVKNKKKNFYPRRESNNALTVQHVASSLYAMRVQLVNYTTTTSVPVLLRTGTIVIISTTISSSSCTSAMLSYMPPRLVFPYFLGRPNISK